MHEVLVNRLGGLSLPRKSVVRLTDRPDMTLDVYRGRKTTIQPTNSYTKGLLAEICPSAIIVLMPVNQVGTAFEFAVIFVCWIIYEACLNFRLPIQRFSPILISFLVFLLLWLYTLHIYRNS